MIELTGRIKTVSPVHIGTGKKTGTFAKTLGYLPGRTLRGMVGYYLYNNDRELFNRLKLSEDKDMSNTGIFFKDALPFFTNKNSELLPTIACPIVLKWCKKCHHLIEDEKEGCKNLVDEKECLQEGKKLVGYITPQSLDKGILEEGSVQRHISTKCPITRNGHTSPGSDYELSPYNVEGIVPGSWFGFKCIVEDEYAEDIKEALNRAGVFSGIGGYRSRGYGTIVFSDLQERSVADIIEERKAAISDLNEVMLVSNSQLILKKGGGSVIGFDDTFEEYSSKVPHLNSGGICQVSCDDNGPRQRLSRGTARGWSIKNENKVSEIIKCIGSGSCVQVKGDPEDLAIMEVYGVGEMTNSGYGDVYFMEARI